MTKDPLRVSAIRLARTALPRPVRLALLGNAGILRRPAHQRRIIAAEKHLAEADRRLDLHLPVAAGPCVAAPQRLHLLNSTHIQRKLEQGPKLQSILRARGTPRELVDSLYLTILSRPATADEHQLAAEYATTVGDRRTAALDLAWALINSTEFLYRH